MFRKIQILFYIAVTTLALFIAFSVNCSALEISDSETGFSTRLADDAVIVVTRDGCLVGEDLLKEMETDSREWVRKLKRNNIIYNAVYPAYEAIVYSSPNGMSNSDLKKMDMKEFAKKLQQQVGDRYTVESSEIDVVEQNGVVYIYSYLNDSELQRQHTHIYTCDGRNGYSMFFVNNGVQGDVSLASVEIGYYILPNLKFKNMSIISKIIKILILVLVSFSAALILIGILYCKIRRKRLSKEMPEASKTNDKRKSKKNRKSKNSPGIDDNQIILGAVNDGSDNSYTENLSSTERIVSVEPTVRTVESESTIKMQSDTADEVASEMIDNDYEEVRKNQEDLSDVQILSEENIRVLREFKKLLDEGIITQEEFENKKAQLLR